VHLVDVYIRLDFPPSFRLLLVAHSIFMANKQRPTAVTGDHNITGKYLNNVGNVENYITISHPVAGNSEQLLSPSIMFLF